MKVIKYEEIELRIVSNECSNSWVFENGRYCVRVRKDDAWRAGGFKIISWADILEREGNTYEEIMKILDDFIKHIKKLVKMSKNKVA